MATAPLGGDALPFKIPTDFELIKAIDAEFWRLHATWRRLEDEMEASPYSGDDPEGQAMIDVASEARDAMFLRGCWTAAALLTRLEAFEEGGVCNQQLRPGISVFDMLKWDAERVAKREMGLWDPMLAL